MDRDRRLEALQTENDTLRAQVAELEALLFAPAFAAPVEWRLTGSEACVFAALVARELATRACLMTALYDGPDAAHEKIFDVFICKLRKKLRPFGITIQTVVGQGWRLDAATRARFRARPAISEGRRA